jgi:hypothetical protein
LMLLKKKQQIYLVLQECESNLKFLW